MCRPRVFSLCIVLLIGTNCSAQEPSKYFGFGLQKFYQADYEGAIVELDNAEQLGMKDGRLFYFRGIAKLRAGHDKEGRVDLERGARYEANVGPRYIGRLADRLQESELTALAEFRTKARVAAAEHRTMDVNAGDLAKPRRKSIVAFSNDSIGADETDPFLDDSLGRGEFVNVVAQATVADEFDSGSSTDLATDPEPFSDDDSGFGDFGGGNEFANTDAETTGDAAPMVSSDPTEKKRRGLFGTVFRAIGKSAIPVDAAEQLMSQIPIPGGPTMGPAGGSPPEPVDGDVGDDFGGFEESADDTIDGFEDMSEDEGDPFGDDF